MATVTILKIRILSDSPAPEIQNIELNALAAAAGTQSSTNWKSKAWLWNTTFGSKWKYVFPWIFNSFEAFQKLCLLVSGSPWLRQNLKITKIHCRPTSWYLTASWTPGDTWTRGYAEIGHRANQVNCKIAKFIQLKLKVWAWQYLNKL